MLSQGFDCDKVSYYFSPPDLAGGAGVAEGRRGSLTAMVVHV